MSKKKRLESAKTCSFIVAPYQRSDDRCMLQVFNGNDYPVKIAVKKMPKCRIVKALPNLAVKALASLVWLFAALTSPVDARTVSDTEAVRAIVGEASTQGIDGMTAVGEVIRRRGSVKGLYGYNAMATRLEPEWVWEQARRAWKRSETTNLSRGATLFENVYAFGFPKSWDRTKVVCVAQIKDHWFFREIKG